MCQLLTHLVYFWMPISLGIESGRMIMRHMTKSAKRWSVYQWYGISPSVFPVTVSYRDRHTETHRHYMFKRVKDPFVSLSCVYIHIHLLQLLTLKHNDSYGTTQSAHNLHLSSWSCTTTKKATEIMKRLKTKQISHRWPILCPHTSRTTSWYVFCRLIDEA